MNLSRLGGEHQALTRTRPLAGLSASRGFSLHCRLVPRLGHYNKQRDAGWEALRASLAGTLEPARSCASRRALKAPGFGHDWRRWARPAAWRTYPDLTQRPGWLPSLCSRM
jgi:hypothetical protein